MKNFGKNFEKFSKIFKNFFTFFFGKNHPEWYPRILDTPLSLYISLDTWHPTDVIIWIISKIILVCTTSLVFWAFCFERDLLVNFSVLSLKIGIYSFIVRNKLFSTKNIFKMHQTKNLKNKLFRTILCNFFFTFWCKLHRCHRFDDQHLCDR